MKNITLFLALWGVFVPIVGTPAPSTHDLIILLDYGQSEELLRSGATGSGVIHGQAVDPLAKLGAITSTLIPALYQKVAPILVSRSLLYSLLVRKNIFHDCLTKDISELNRLYGRQAITKAPSLLSFKQHCLYADKMYKAIQQEIKTICQKGTSSEIDQAFQTLTSKQPYLETSAPRTLHLYSSEKRSMTETLHKELQVYALCHYAPLTEEHYLIKEVSQDLALLIPRSCIKGAAGTYSQNTGLTPLEKELGLKINHLKDLTTKELLQNSPVTYGTPLADHLKRICITKKEGGNQVWTVYVSGHGLPSYPERRKIEHLTRLRDLYRRQLDSSASRKPEEKRTLSLRHTLMEEELAKTGQRLAQLPAYYEKVICSISVDEFKRTLHFLNNEINTSLFLYSCCYGGGEHLIAPYQDTTKVLNFDCIAGSFSDTVSFQDVPMLLLPPYNTQYKSSSIITEGLSEQSIDPLNKCLTPHISTHFGDFFRKAKDHNRNAFTLIDCLHPYVKGGKIRHIENIALQRPKGTTSFTVVQKGDSISCASSNTLSTSVDVALLTKPRYGQIRLEEHVPSFVSTLEGPAYHVIETLDAVKQSLSNLAESFLELETLSTPKVFWIKKLTCKRETPPPFFLPLEFLKPLIRGKESSPTVLHDVIILRNVPTSESLKHDASIGIYFSDTQGTTWYLPIKRSWGMATKVTKNLAHAELFALFPGLREAI